jgi:hypothetical protein
MNTKTKIFIIAIIIAAGGVCYILFFTGNPHPYQSVDYIAQRVVNGKIVDYVRDISNEPLTVNQISYKVSPQGIYYIQYGKIQIELTPKLLKDETMLSKLRKIGIEVLQNSTSETYVFKWFGEDVKQVLWDINKGK